MAFTVDRTSNVKNKQKTELVFDVATGDGVFLFDLFLLLSVSVFPFSS